MRTVKRTPCDQLRLHEEEISAEVSDVIDDSFRPGICFHMTKDIIWGNGFD